MFTTLAFQQSIDPAGVFTQVAPAGAEQSVTIRGNAIQVPTLSQILAAAAGVEIAVESFARFVSPSLRQLLLENIEPFSSAAAGAVTPASPHPVLDRRTSPVPLVPGEALTFELSSNPAAAQIQWGVIWLADGPVAPVAGPIRTARATGATALVASAWTAVPLSFTEDLPRGRYQLVGLRARSAGLVAARVVFVGPSAQARPGCLGSIAQQHIHHEMFRMGQLGVWGEFEDIEPPQIECLAVSADAAEDFYLDLIQTRSGPG